MKRIVFVAIAAWMFYSLGAHGDILVPGDWLAIGALIGCLAGIADDLR